MTTIAAAVSVLAAVGTGDGVATPERVPPARPATRPTPRRDRQVIEIAGLVVAGHRARATGLALEHAVEFPDDADLLAGLTAEQG